MAVQCLRFIMFCSFFVHFWRRPFQRNTIWLPPDIAFQVHLMCQLNKHWGNDLNMFHEIITCMKSHAVHHNVDFSTLQILSRKQLVKLLTKYYQMDFLKPRLHSVPLSGGTVATMTVFDVKWPFQSKTQSTGKPRYLWSF